MDRKDLIHYLRNPYDLDKHGLRKVRLQAADELEKFYELERQIKDIDALRSNSEDSLKGFSKLKNIQINSHEEFLNLQELHPDHILVPATYFFPYQEKGYKSIWETRVLSGKISYVMMKLK